VAGEALEESLEHGVPKDEAFWYAHALREGHSVLVVLADHEAQRETARRVLHEAGAESLDAAREQWWIGLRSAERERYVGGAVAFDRAEPSFRRGFEAALRVGLRGRTYAEAQAELRDLYPELYANEAFREGYERGSAYYSGLARSEREAA
jgi:hypothetical protein